ncbi:MAG: hypothetical protein JXR13_19960 [Thalassovita sp.]
MLFRVMVILLIGVVSACTNANDLDEAPPSLGDFNFGHNIVVAPNLVKGPVSRNASEEEWVAALTTAFDDRFSRYDGDRLYHFGVSVLGYVLARPGVPVLASPKSVLILNIDVWDDAKGERLSEEREQITVLETLSGETFVGSGLTQSKEKQLENLSKNASKMVETYLVRKHKQEGWFGPQIPDAEPEVIEPVAPEVDVPQSAEIDEIPATDTIEEPTTATDA